MTWYGAIGERRSSSGISSSVRVSSDGSPATPSPLPPLEATTKAAFYLFGVVSNMPWNALILSLPYLLDRLDGSPLQTYLGSSMVITFNVSGLIALTIATWLADKLRPTLSIIISICGIFLTLLVLATTPLWPSQILFFAVLVGAFALALAKSFLKTPIVSIATTFGPDALASYLSGTSLIAVVISAGVFLAAYLSNTNGVTDGKTGTIVSFSLCACVSLSALVAFRFAIQNTEIYKTKFNSLPKHTDPERDRLLQMQLRMVLAQGDGIWATTRRNWGYNVAQCWLYVVTVAVFPAITTNVKPLQLPWTPLVFRAFHLLVFNAGDFTGRLIVSIRPTSTSIPLLWAYSALQTAIAPLFLLCNLHPRSPTPTSPASTLVIGDLGFLVLVFVFALTSGHASSLGFVAVGSKKGARARSGARVLQLWMVVGYVLGGAASFGVGRWWT